MTAKPETESGTSRVFDSTNWVSSDPLPRDREQSRRLHEPTFLMSSIDPITGHDIMDRKGHPTIVDGNMTMYFESEETKQAYIDTPMDHPLRLQDNPYEDGEAEG